MAVRRVGVAVCVTLLFAALAARPTAALRSEWSRVGRPSPTAVHRLTIGLALTPGTEPLLVDTCKGVSDPDSPKYGQHLSRDEVAALVRSDAHLDTVRAFFAPAAATVAPSPTRDALRVTITAAALERLLGVELAVFSHVDAPRMRVVRSATGPAKLPPAVEAAIDVLIGVSDFPTPDRNIMKHARKVAAEAVEAEVEHAAAKLRTAGGAAAAAGMQVPNQPIVGLMYVSDTQATLMVLQACGQKASTAPMPCAGSPYAVERYEARVYVDGTLVGDSIAVPLTDVTPEIQPSAQANQTVYNVAIPVPLKEFQMVNVSLRAVNSAGASGYGQLPWKNQNSFTDAYRRMKATPYVTPQLLTELYGLGDMPSPLPAGLTQAVAEFGGQYYSPVDLANFFAHFKLPAGTVTVVGPNDGPQSGGEASLDIDYIMAVAPGVDTTFWSVAPQGPVADSFLFAWASQVNAATNPPLVTSISYGLGEDQYAAAGLGNHYIRRTNVEFLKLCARGVSIVTAAGDAGASNDGHGSTTCAVQPDFPSSSPWATVVSASFITNDGPMRPNINMGEQAISIPNGMFWTTGGGFSSMPSCQQPWYQQDVVKSYVQDSGAVFPPTSVFNASLRAYPDVSAIGHNLMVQWGGTLVSIDGTSASSPIFAGILTRLNAARMSIGKSPLGFANPVLYKVAAALPTAFHDITIGDNRCAGFTCCTEGYECTKGFDAVSGLGSIGDFAAVKNMVMSLP